MAGTGDRARPAVEVLVAADLADLVPAFLERRRAEVDTLRARLADGALDEIARAAHRIKGTAGGYGFEGLRAIAARLEAAALAGDVPGAARAVGEMGEHLERVTVRIEGPGEPS